MEYGSGKYRYELVDPWAKLPEGESFIDVAGISIDSDDKIYVFNRSQRPMIVFDRDGNEVASWGEGRFKRPHGSFMTPDGHIYLTDDYSHVVYKFTKEDRHQSSIRIEGRLLFYICING